MPHHEIISQAFEANVNTTPPLCRGWNRNVGFAYFADYKLKELKLVESESTEEIARIKAHNASFSPSVGDDVSNYYTELFLLNTQKGYYVLGDDWVEALFLAHTPNAL